MEEILFVLKYHPAEKRTIIKRVEDLEEKGLEVNQKKRTWSWDKFQDISFGHMRRLESEEPYKEGILGVYRNNSSDVSTMMEDSHHATKWLDYR